MGTGKFNARGSPVMDKHPMQGGGGGGGGGGVETLLVLEAIKTKIGPHLMGH